MLMSVIAGLLRNPHAYDNFYWGGEGVVDGEGVAVKDA